MKRIIVSFVLIGLLTACSVNSQQSVSKSSYVTAMPSSTAVITPSAPNESANPTNNKGEQLQNSSDNIGDLIKNYEKGIIDAINNNDFTFVKPYLLKDSSLYKDQKSLVSDLNEKGIKENLISFDTV